MQKKKKCLHGDVKAGQVSSQPASHPPVICKQGRWGSWSQSKLLLHVAGSASLMPRSLNTNHNLILNQVAAVWPVRLARALVFDNLGVRLAQSAFFLQNYSRMWNSCRVALIKTKNWKDIVWWLWLCCEQQPPLLRKFYLTLIIMFWDVVTKWKALLPWSKLGTALDLNIVGNNWEEKNIKLAHHKLQIWPKCM